MSIDLPLVSFSAGVGETEVDVWETSRRVLEVRTPTGGTVQVRTFWFPGWRGYLSGEPLELKAPSPLGAITFDVPPGDHAIELRFEATPVRRVSSYLGLAAALALGALVLPLSAGSPRPDGA
jgi:hypothetical protein